MRFHFTMNLSRTISEEDSGNEYSVSKRVHLTLPDRIHDDLERWADFEGDNTASFAARLVIKAVEEARKEGAIPPHPKPDAPIYETLTQLIVKHESRLVESGKFSSKRLKALMSGEFPSEIERVRIALLCGISEELVLQLVEKGQR